MKIGKLLLVGLVGLVVFAGCGSPFAIRHRVEPGEDLAAVAARHGVTERDIQTFNRLRAEDRLRPGDIVFIPGDRRPAPETKSDADPGPDEANGSPSTPRAAARPEKSATAKPKPRTTRLAWPVEGTVVGKFGAGPEGENQGLDIDVPPGTEVRAAAAGVVAYAGSPARAYGTLVILDHAGGLHTVYSGLKERYVKREQSVEAGQVVGVSGDPAAGPLSRLHFEVREGQKPRDPLLFLPPR